MSDSSLFLVPSITVHPHYKENISRVKKILIIQISIFNLPAIKTRQEPSFSLFCLSLWGKKNNRKTQKCFSKVGQLMTSKMMIIMLNIMVDVRDS